MNNFINNYVVGIDISSKSSVITILSPNGAIYKKNLVITNDLLGFTKLLSILQYVQITYSSKPVLFMESTGLYHLPLYNYFTKMDYDCSILNPIQTKNFAKQSIRKVKNDKVDALRIAQLAQSPTFSTNFIFDENTFLLKKLCREYESLISNSAQYKKKINALLNLVFPKFNKVFSDIFSPVPLELLSKYPTYIDFLNAPKKSIFKILTTTISHSKEWAEKKYSLLLEYAKEAHNLMLPTDYLNIEILCFINIIKTFISNIATLKSKIIELHKLIPNLEVNTQLLCSHPEVGEISAISFLAEIGNINNFSNAKKLVAFVGVDASVSQSGTFNSTHNHLTKRGSRLARKLLFNLAIASIKVLRNGVPANPILYEYYKTLSSRKPKKVAICAIMRKLIIHFFAILRDQTSFEFRLPEVHKELFITHQL